MSSRTWTLIDTEQDVYVEDLSIDPSRIDGMATGYQVRKRRLGGGLRDGLDVVEIDNGTVRFTVLASRGMGIWRMWRGDVELGWKSPVRGPVHPKFVPLTEPGGLGWLSGFDELLVRCGLESNGPPVFDDGGRLIHPLHGRVANTPAWRLELTVDGDAGDIVLQGVVDEGRLFHNKLRLTSTISTHLGEAGFRLRDEITNLSAEPGECELLYHVNFGKPLLDVGCKVVAPVKTLAPSTPRAAEGLADWDTYSHTQAGFAEQVYFTELHAANDGHTQVLLRNADGTQGASLKFDTRQLPYFVVWKSMQPAEDGYVTGLEPALNLPNPRSFEKQQGRVVPLSPGQTLNFDLQLEAHATSAEVEQAEQKIARLQQMALPVIHQQPRPEWSQV